MILTMDITQVIEFIYSSDPAVLSTVMDALADRMDALFGGQQAEELVQNPEAETPTEEEAPAEEGGFRIPY